MSNPVHVKVTLNRILLALVGREELVEEWWLSKNKAFNMKTPNEVYLSNEEGRKQVIDYVLFHYGGNY